MQSAELGRLRATYEESLAGLRGEHETVVARLTQLRDSERDAVRTSGQFGGSVSRHCHRGAGEYESVVSHLTQRGTPSEPAASSAGQSVATARGGGRGSTRHL